MPLIALSGQSIESAQDMGRLMAYPGMTMQGVQAEWWQYCGQGTVLTHCWRRIAERQARLMGAFAVTGLKSRHIGDIQQVESMAHELNSTRYPIGIAVVEGAGTALAPLAQPGQREWPCAWELYWTLIPLEPFPAGSAGYFDPTNNLMRPAYVRVAAQLPNHIIEIRQPGGTRQTLFY
eukprot:1303924-Rhodomonas_salina.2